MNDSGDSRNPEGRAMRVHSGKAMYLRSLHKEVERLQLHDLPQDSQGRSMPAEVSGVH
jgi:hypothetical protein